MSQSACIISVSGPVLLDEERAFLRDQDPWGVILMGRSCVSRDQVRKLVEDIHDALQRQALIFIDQEGGRVARLKSPEWPKFPAAGHYGTLYEANETDGLEACAIGHHLMALELTDIGITADCGPVGDLRQADTHDAIGDRAFSYSVTGASALGAVALAGLAQGGVAGVIKHMPGQGRATADSHYDLPVVEASNAALQDDFSVFTGLSMTASMGMTGHVAYANLDGKTPATLSEIIISQTIRERIGFDGLLMTDDLGMNALGGDLKDRGARALAAGCDVLLHCSGFLSDPVEILNEMKDVTDAAGPMTEAAQKRADRVMSDLKPPQHLDREAGWDRLTELLSRVPAGS